MGGPGTRLQPLTNTLPKAMVPVLNRPFIEHMISYLEQYDIDEIILTLSYLPDIVRSYFGDSSRLGTKLVYCTEETPMGTAGAVKNAEKHLQGTFIVINGDIFTDLNLTDMLAFHRKSGATATISLQHAEDTRAFGVVETDDNLRVKKFTEKPSPGEVASNWINAGTYILEPEVMQRVPPDTFYMFEKGFFADLLEMDKPVYGYPHRGYWLDMGNPGKYLSLNADLLSSKISSPLVKLPEDGILTGNGATVHPSTRITAPVIIGEGCRIGSMACIRGPVVIGPGCCLETGVTVEGSLLWENVTVGNGTRLNQCIVSDNVQITSGEKIDGCVVTPDQSSSFS